MKNQPTGQYGDDLAGWLESWKFLNGTVPFSEEAAKRYTQSLYEGDPRNTQIAENHIHAMSTVPISLVTQIQASTRPLLVIHGTDDPLVPLDHGEATAMLIRGSKLNYLPDAGHMFFNVSVWDLIGLYVEEHIMIV